MEKLLKKPLELKVFILLFAFFLLAFAASQFWHSSPRLNFLGPSLALKEYDSVVFNRESCISIEYYPLELDFNRGEKLVVFTGPMILASETVNLGEEKRLEKRVCFDAAELEAGHYIVEVMSYHNSLFYHLEKKPGPGPEEPEPELGGISLENGILNFSVSNFPENSYKPVEIFVNGELDHRVYPAGKEQEFRERISLEEGENLVELRLGAVSMQVEAVREDGFRMPYFFGIFLLVLSLFVFSCFVFPDYKLYKKLALAFGFTAAAFILIVMALGLLGLLSVFSFLGVFLSALAVVAFAFRHNFALSKPGSILKMDRAVLVVVLAFVLISVGFHLFTFSHMTYWNGFYERMGLMITEQNAIPELDPLSYFGRGYTFTPGYFYFNAGMAWLTGLEGQALFAMIMAFSNALFFFSVYYLGRSLGLGEKKGALFALLIISEGFLLVAVTLSPRHAMAFALFALSLALHFDKRHPLLVGSVLGLTAIVQTPLLIFFPAFVIIASKKIEWKPMVLAFLIGGAIFLALFAPSLIRYGMPYQVESGNWGYLIKYPLHFLWRDFVILVVFFLLFYLIDLLRRRIKFSPYTQKLFIAVILGFLVQTFVTYRFNVVTALTIGLLLAMWFPAKKLKDIHFERICIIILIAALWYLPENVNSIQDIGYGPMVYLKENTSTGSRILADPLYGHSIGYFAERPYLADLMVEYADQEKLDDAYRFLEDKDYSVLEKYSIEYTLNQSNYINRMAMEGTPTKDPIEFREIDKVYANTFLFVHRNRGK